MNKYEQIQMAVYGVLVSAMETIIELDDVYRTPVAAKIFGRLVGADSELDEDDLFLFAEWYLYHFRPNGRDAGIRFVLDQGFFESGSEAEAVAEALARTCAWRSYDVLAVRDDGRAILADAFTGAQERFFSPALAMLSPGAVGGRASMFSVEIDGVWYQAGPSIFLASSEDPDSLPLMSFEEFYVRSLEDD